ncbi:RING-H2 finger protein ATL18 [Hibiscus syriacus]|uniref:RING-H2 finger protein ATL18 n=1 Tax=Hibiscus syriacus TaxID=106335 RepID=A0A6A2Z8V9_HIBSY|nr:probable E3 ubiquitin-protein ligase XERICO [Hibiscus syriacus]XP_039018172.1 probable E3 ubiquitin-protein ligase XERICO [Hibiscus syriacus]KAE8687966.1 RING-H2 finger protein ATL18 [Hibiscus syriacus]KAE8687967.1 RING-H2 finger protein ATL18 [Hibiscus syriacus]
MGLSNFPSSAEGVLPVLVVNTVLSVALLKNMARSLLQVLGSYSSSNLDIEDGNQVEETMNNAKERRISITQFKSLCHDRCSPSSSREGSVPESEACCVCLTGFEADEEVSELSCKHFFHKSCLEKWFGNKHSTCPLCRSVD